MPGRLSIATLALVLGSFFFSAHLCYSGPACHALTLGGGGDRGAYEAGAIAGLVECLPPGQAQWTVVTGISAGAINAAGFSQFGVGQEPAAAQFLLEKWLSIERKDIWEDWPGGPAQGFLLESGLLNSAPEKVLLASLLNVTALRTSGRSMRIGSTRLDNGNFEIFTENDPDPVEAAMCSSAIPGVFPSQVRKNGFHYVDGGLDYMTPVTDSVVACRAKYPVHSFFFFFFL